MDIKSGDKNPTEKNYCSMSKRSNSKRAAVADMHEFAMNCTSEKISDNSYNTAVPSRLKRYHESSSISQNSKYQKCSDETIRNKETVKNSNVTVGQHNINASALSNEISDKKDQPTEASRLPKTNYKNIPFSRFLLDMLYAKPVQSQESSTHEESNNVFSGSSTTTTASSST